MRHIHMMVFVHSSEPAGLPGDLGQPYRAVPGMGLPFGPASPVGMDWACCCEALPCGAGALCMQSVCGESRYLAVLPDTKEIHCSHLDFSWKWSFGGFYTTKKNCCPQPRIGILALLALLPGFSQAAHFSIAWHCPQACPCWWPPAFPSLLGEPLCQRWGWWVWVEGHLPCWGTTCPWTSWWRTTGRKTKVADTLG